MQLSTRLGVKPILLSNGMVLVAGGYNSDTNTDLVTAELYDPGNNSWTSTGSMIQSRTFVDPILLPSGKVLVAGGGDRTGTVLVNAELYDPGSGTWNSTGSMAQRTVTPLKLLSNGKVLMIEGTFSPLASAELYIPEEADSCFFSWGEANYPSFVSPSGAITLTYAPYTYRYYENTNAYLGLSSTDNHLYYFGSDNVMMDLGDSAIWMHMAGC